MLIAENLDSVIKFLSQAESQKPPTHKINRSDKPREKKKRLFEEKGDFVKESV